MRRWGRWISHDKRMMRTRCWRRVGRRERRGEEKGREGKGREKKRRGEEWREEEIRREEEMK